MDKNDVVNLIKDIIQSYENNPSQNHFAVNVIGTNIVSNGAGNGLFVSTVGGGPGSTTIGMQSSMNTSQISITRPQINKVMNDLNESIISNLVEINEELINDKPNKSKILGFFDNLLKIVGQTAMTVVVEGLLKSQGINF